MVCRDRISVLGLLRISESGPIFADMKWTEKYESLGEILENGSFGLALPDICRALDIDAPELNEMVFRELGMGIDELLLKYCCEWP